MFGGGKDPVLGELVVTENGVYDDPVIGAELDFSVGKTVQFKESYTLEDIPAEYYPAEGKPNAQHLIINNTKYRAMFGIQNGGILLQVYTDMDESEHTLSYMYVDEITGIAVAPNIGEAYVGAGWYVGGADMPISLTDNPPIITIVDETSAESLAILAFLFAAPSTPADGWNKVTVNVAGDIIDVDELPTENIEEGKIYRVIEETEETVDMYIYADGRGMLVEEYVTGVLGATMPSITYEMVDALPVESADPYHIFILKETGIGHMYAAGQWFGFGFGITGGKLSDKGYTNDISSITENGVYTIYTPAESSTTYGIPDEANNKTVMEHNGSEWVECGGESIVVDVEELPTENVDDGKIYRMNVQNTDNVYIAGKLTSEELEVMTVADVMSAAFSMAGSAILVETPIYTVDILPENLEQMAFTESGLILPCYVLNSTGIVYVNSGQGDAQTLGTMFSGVDGGWVVSANSIVATDVMTVYAVRGGLNTAYGVPNDNDNKFIYEYSSKNGWVDVKKFFNDKITAIKSELQVEIDSLEEQNAELLNEKESIENQNSELTNRLENIFNIAYGDEEPTDTSKLWVKTSEPSNVLVAPVDTSEKGVVTTLETVIPWDFDDNYNYTYCATVGKKIYWFAGYGASEDSVHNIYYFDTETSTATTLSNKKTDSGVFCTCAAVGSKIYIFGGHTMGNINAYSYGIRCFDTETETYSDITPADGSDVFGGDARQSCIAIDKKIYIFGGVKYDHIYCFDTETNILEQLIDLSLNSRPGIAAVEENIYIFDYKAVYCFDTRTRTYTKLSTEIPGTGDLTYSFCNTIGSSIYIVHGGEVMVFDTGTESIIFSNAVLTGRSSFAVCGCIDNKIYTIVSIKDSDKCKVSCFYPFKYVLKLEENNLQIIPSLEKNIFKLTNEESKSVKIGVHEVYKGNSEGKGEPVEAAFYKDGAWANI